MGDLPHEISKPLHQKREADIGYCVGGLGGSSPLAEAVACIRTMQKSLNLVTYDLPVYQGAASFVIISNPQHMYFERFEVAPTVVIQIETWRGQRYANQIPQEQPFRGWSARYAPARARMVVERRCWESDGWGGADLTVRYGCQVGAALVRCH
eukprot:748144-Hanusia_phi.AAC.1